MPAAECKRTEGELSRKARKSLDLSVCNFFQPDITYLR
jgi:hypothetical protein